MASIGGQAVLEGVMMRGPSSWAVAVRRPDGRISEVEHDVDSVALHRRWLRLPVIRGVVALGESLAIGMRALAVSARFSVTDEGEEDASEELGKWALVGSFVFAIGFSLILFKVSPALLTNWINPGNTFVFVLDRGRHPHQPADRLPGPDRAVRRAAARVPVPRRRAQGDQRLRGRRAARRPRRCSATASSTCAAAPRSCSGSWSSRSSSSRRSARSSAHIDWYWLVLSRIVALPLIAGLAYEVIRLAARFEHIRARARRARAGALAAAPDDARADARPGRRLDPRRSSGCSRPRSAAPPPPGPRVEVMA